MAVLVKPGLFGRERSITSMIIGVHFISDRITIALIEFWLKLNYYLSIGCDVLILILE